MQPTAAMQPLAPPVQSSWKLLPAASSWRHAALSFVLGMCTMLALVSLTGLGSRWPELHSGLLSGSWVQQHLSRFRDGGAHVLAPPMPPSPAPLRDGASTAQQQQERQRTRAEAAGGRQPAPPAAAAAAAAAAVGRPGQQTGGGGGKQAPRPAQKQKQQQQQQQSRPPRVLPPLPWPPRLAQHEVERGISYYGSGDRLRAVAAKLLAGQPIKAYTMGGSVTAGNGASDLRFCYASRFFEFLNTTFPHRDHVLVNKGIGATSSGIFAACTERMVPNDTDLVVLEFSLNDPENLPYASGDRRGYEQLVRHLLRLPGRPALLQLHHFRWWHPVPDSTEVEDGLFYETNLESQLEVFALYYDIPAISLRAAVHPLMRAGLNGFKVDAVMSAGPGGTLNYHIPTAKHEDWSSLFFQDKSHPSDGGHQVLAELLAAAVLRAASEVAAPAAAAAALGISAWPAGSRLGADKGAVPPPMIPGNVDTANTLCAIQEDFKSAVVAAEGFEYRPERPNATSFVTQKWAWTGLEPGAWAELEFDSRSEALSKVSAGKNSTDDKAIVYIMHLKSYEGMGAADVTCVSGCSCPPFTLDGTWTTPASLQRMLKMLVSQHARCRVRVAISIEPGSVPQQGHKVSLSGLLVSHFPVRVAGAEGVETFTVERADNGRR